MKLKLPARAFGLESLFTVGLGGVDLPYLFLSSLVPGWSFKFSSGAVTEWAAAGGCNKYRTLTTVPPLSSWLVQTIHLWEINGYGSFRQNLCGNETETRTIMGRCILCQTFTLQLMWEFKWVLHFGIVLVRHHSHISSVWMSHYSLSWDCWLYLRNWLDTGGLRMEGWERISASALRIYWTDFLFRSEDIVNGFPLPLWGYIEWLYWPCGRWTR